MEFRFRVPEGGDITWLRKAGACHKVEIDVVHPLRLKEETISSTHIRTLLLNGEIEKANRLLGRVYHFESCPVKGRGVGKTIGVPTINLSVPSHKLLPSGVSVVLVKGKDKEWPGLINIGTRPTFMKKSAVVPEINLFGFTGKWPKSCTSVSFCRHLRNERKFSSVEDLQRQIRHDRERAMEYLGISNAEFRRSPLRRVQSRCAGRRRET